MTLRQPLLLRLEFQYPLEQAGSTLGKIIGSLQRPMFKCNHWKYSISLIVVTDESARDLVKRLGLDDIDAVEDYCCHVAPIGAITKHGGMNSFFTSLDKAWDAVGKRRHPEYVRQTKRFDPRFEDRVKDPERGAVSKMKVKPPRVWQPPKNPYR